METKKEKEKIKRRKVATINYQDLNALEQEIINALYVPAHGRLWMDKSIRKFHISVEGGHDEFISNDRYVEIVNFS